MAPSHSPTPSKMLVVGREALLKTIVHLWPYIWPSDRPDLKLRVVGAMVLLLLYRFIV